MRLKLYRNAKVVGWQGWLESERGHCLGFVRLDGTILWW